VKTAGSGGRELFDGPLEGEQEWAIAHAMAQAASAFFPSLKGADRAAELVGALVKGHVLAIAIEFILVANYWHTKCMMVGCSDNGHLVKLGLATHSVPSMHSMARSLVRSCWRESDAPHLRKRSRRAEVSNTAPCSIEHVVWRHTRAHFT